MPPKPDPKKSGGGDDETKEQQEERERNEAEVEQELARRQAEAADLRQAVEDTISDKSDAYNVIKQFTQRSRVNRMTLESLQKLTISYHKLEEFDSQLAADYSAWSAIVDEEALEKSSDPLAYSKVEALFEEYGEVKDKALELFEEIATQFPSNAKVKDHLSFLLKPVETDLPPLPKSSISCASGKGEAYVKAKIPKIQKSVEDTFANLQSVFAEPADMRSVSLEDVERGLGDLEKKVTVDSAYDKLLRELFELDDTEDVYEAAETWQEGSLESIQKLKKLVQSERKKTGEKASTQSKNSSQTFLKKRDPPTFKGDCLEFMDFKRKWNNLVHSNNPPEEFEMDLLKSNITEQGRKKLFGVESLPIAWKLLDKIYGDKKLICQKLKNKLKNLQPKSTEEHEIIIELSDEVDYLVKRLKELDATSLLQVDNDYLNAVYIHLPKYNQTAWDMFDTDDYADEWQAFMVYMHDISTAALKKRTRVESLKEMERVHEKNPFKKKVSTLTTTVEESNVVKTVDEDTNRQERYKAKFEEIKKKIGKCRCCKGEHSYTNKWNKIWPSDRLFACKKFGNLTPTKRAELLQQVSGCARCTSWQHQKKDCPGQAVVCKEKIDSGQCKGDHSRLLCNSGVDYVNSLLVHSGMKTGTGVDGNLGENDPTLSYQMDVVMGNGNSCRILFDGGSNRVLFNSEFAVENNLYERDASINLNVAGGGHESLDTKIFETDLVDRKGERHAIWGYGLENIIDPDDPIDLSPVRDQFPHIPEAVFQPLTKKRVDILIGLNFNGLHPSGGEGDNCVGNLKVLSTIFGSTGFIVGGTHPLLKCKPLKFSFSVARLRVAKVVVSPIISVEELPEFLPIPNSCSDAYEDPAAGSPGQEETLSDTVKSAKLEVEPDLLPEYWDSDQLSVLPPRRCERCRQCAEKGKCSEQHQLRTLKEEAELKMIADRVEVKDGGVHVQYPFIKDPHILPPNRPVVVKIAGKLWTNLKRDGLLDQYHAEMRKYMERGTFVKLTQKEMDEYEGPHQWITHHGVVKGSVSTPLRVVTNSSFNNHGNSLNSCLPRGPNSLNDLFNITIRFRSYKKVFAYDLAKAYNTMKTGVVEKHLRRFVWRWSEDEPWQDYGIDAVHFGDGPAACQLEVSKQKVGDLGRHIDEEAADKMIEDSYVDDNFSGGEPEAVARMVGIKQPDGNYDGTISEILDIGGFKVKEIVVEGDMDQPDENLLGNAVFGYGWNAKTAVMRLKFHLNMSKKRRGARTGPNLSVENLETLGSFQFTKRTLLGLTNSFGDYLGIAEPYTLKYRLGMKDIFQLDNPLGWDDEISDVMKQTWIDLITETVKAGGVDFPRSTRPSNSIGGPVVAGFGDGGKPAYGASVYLVWEYACKDPACSSQDCLGPDDGGHFQSSLACGKGRVTPLQGYTIPRSELSGATLLSRMMVRVVHALQHLDVQPVLAIMMLDSKCTISLLDANSKILKPFFQNRRAEILENIEIVRKVCVMEEPHYVASALNVSDLVTRGHARLEDVGPGGLWQSGPQFLVLRRDQWPITRDFVRTDLPADEVKTGDKLVTACLRAKINTVSEKLTGKTTDKVENFEAVLCYNNDLESRKRVIARISRGWQKGMFTDDVWNNDQKEFITVEPARQELIAAEKLILKHGMIRTADALHLGELGSLLPFFRDGIIFTRGRLGEKSMEAILGVPELPLLMPDSRVAELFMWRAHHGYSGMFHRSATETLAKSRSSVWIVRGKQLAKKVCSQCMICARERLKKNLESQQMAELKEESSTVCPPWTYICIDYAGPVMIKGEVNTRSRGKAWVLVYTCRSTKAVCLLATAGYSTSHFLSRHAEYVARKGKPRSVVTDRGTNLVKGAITVAEKEKPSNWNWAEVVKANSVSEWEFVPIGSQHRNGIAESTVKVLKKSLSLALPPGVVLSFSELVTLLAQISHSINCRPLGLDRTSGDSQQDDFFVPITPNHLLLGHSGEDAPVLDYEENSPVTARMAYVKEVYETWWRMWVKQVLPTLIPIRKWKKISRNITVGDMCFLYYPGNLKDDYRLVRVVKTHPDKKGIVRTVTIAYRKRDKREKADVYWKKPLTEEQVAVQRLSVFLSAKEQSEKVNDATKVIEEQCVEATHGEIENV